MIWSKKRKDDQEIVTAILEGGSASERMVGELYQSLFSFVNKVKRRYNLSEEEVKDCYSDAITALVNKVRAGEYRAESKLSTYFYSIFSHKCIDRTRHITTQKYEVESSWKQEIPEVTASTWDFLSEWDLKEELSQLEGLMNRIGERCKQLIWDLDYWGYQPEEMISRMGFTSLASIKTQKYKCKQKLRLLIEQRRMHGEF